MILRIVLLFALLMSSIFIGLQLHQDPGHVLIAFNHWTIESTLGVALFGIIIIFFILRSICWLVASISNLPHKYMSWIKLKRTKRAEQQTRQGLIEFTEGQWTLAKKHLANAMPDTPAPLVNYLTAARAAQELGDEISRDKYLEQARTAVPDADIGISLTKSEMLLDNQQFELALSTLEELNQREPNHPYVLQYLMRAHEALHNYTQCMLLLPTCKRLKVFPENQMQALEKRIYLHDLIQHIEHDSLDVINKYISGMPKKINIEQDIQTVYAVFLIEKKQDLQAEAVLRKALKIKLSNDMLEMYGNLKPGCAQRYFIDGLLKKQASNAGLWLCLARIDAKDNLWGQAKHAFETSIKLNPTLQAYYGLGALYEQLQMPELALTAYRSGLDLGLN